MKAEVEPLNPSQGELAANHLRFALAIARPFRLKVPRLRDEIESASLFGVVKAASGWDESRDVKFKTYAKAFIVGEIKEVFRRRHQRWNFHSESMKSPALVVDATDPVGWEVDQHDSIDSILGGLEGDQLSVMALIFKSGTTHAEASRRLKIPISTTWHRYRGAIEKLNRKAKSIR